MLFNELALYFQKLEQTSARNLMVEILAELFKKAKIDEAEKISYLLQGRVAPLFVPLEFGIAEKTMIKVIGFLGIDEKEIKAGFAKSGDLGKTIEYLKSKKLSSETGLTVLEVFNSLSLLPTITGKGSQEKKIKVLGSLLAKADPLSANYIVRIPLGKLRLGFSDMTILDSFSWMITGSKILRPEIEKAYNVRPDLGFIAQLIKKEVEKIGKNIEETKGILREVRPEVGTPILMARCERLNTPEEILEKTKGKAAVELKYDGFRCQVHKMKDKIRIFSRNLEDVTFMYPDIIEGTKKQIKAESAVFEGEAVSFNEKTGEFLPFQEIVVRKRKYDIEKTARELPLTLFCFEVLYVEGESFLDKPFWQRREKLEEILKSEKQGVLRLSEEKIADNKEVLKNLFDEAVSRGLEGLVVKKLDGVYQAGARNFNWIKFKRGFAGRALTDTIDCLIMGYDFGQGKRTSFGIGDFLIGVYDKEAEMFKTVAKVGTGATDEEWREIKRRCDLLKVKEKPKEYEADKTMFCDVWVNPSLVVEILADEITRSPVHTAGRSNLSKSGFALRFPRLVKFRDDKKPRDATGLKEIEAMYKNQSIR